MTVGQAQDAYLGQPPISEQVRSLAYGLAEHLHLDSSSSQDGCNKYALDGSHFRSERAVPAWLKP